MSYYSFYDEKGNLIKEIFAYSRDSAFAMMKDKWKTYKRRKFTLSGKGEQDE